MIQESIRMIAHCQEVNCGYLENLILYFSQHYSHQIKSPDSKEIFFRDQADHSLCSVCGIRTQYQSLYRTHPHF